jgi:2-furoate---CoA ligase
MAMDLGTVLRWTAERYPQRRAVGGRAPMSYREWDAHSNRLARTLADLGVGFGDRVVLLMAGGEPLASLHLAAQKLGAVSVPLSYRFGVPELAYCLSDAEPALVIVDESTSPVLEEALDSTDQVPWIRSGPRDEATVERLSLSQPDGPLDVRVSDQDVGVMLYTSGTTGRPKGVPRTHRAEHHAAVAHLLQSGQSAFDTTLVVMPLFHTMGLRTLIATVVGSGTWVPQTRFDAEETLSLIEQEEITSLYLVPTIYWSLLRTGRLGEAGSVRNLAYAGSSMTPALVEQLTETLRPESFVNHFGSTEIYTFTIGPDVVAKPGCAGRAGVFSRIRLVEPVPDASPEAVVAPGEQGQLAVSMSSPEAFGGYWRRPDADAKSIRAGWYFPGDLGVLDEDGDLWVSGRIDDMINSGGENIYPDEIEDRLIRCPAVSEVVVVGLADDRWGQAATAFFVPDAGMTADHALEVLALYVREGSGLPSLKRPKRLIAVDELPKSGAGKVLRRQLSRGEYHTRADSATGDK